MEVEIFLRRDEFLERMNIHVTCPTERAGSSVVPDILVAVADTYATVKSVPVGIIVAVVGGVVPYLAVGEAGVVHLVDYGQTRLNVGSNVRNLVMCHSVTFQF